MREFLYAGLRLHKTIFQQQCAVVATRMNHYLANNYNNLQTIPPSVDLEDQSLEL